MQMDYSWFHLRSVIDWLDLEVRTQGRHPAWRVHRAGAGAFSYVTGLDPVTGQNIEITGKQGTNAPTTRFVVRIQAPERFASITAALATISDLDSSATILVCGIELALDAYRLPGTTDDQLAEMVAIMLHQINRPDGANEVPRLYSWCGNTELRYGEKSLKAAILSGKTAMYGNRDDDYIVRGYLKNYDTQRDESGKNHRIAITDTQKHRARIEVRLQGQNCPVRTLEDLKKFKFESLARFFKFHEPASDSKASTKLIANRLGSLGSVIDGTGKAIAAHANKGRSRKSRNSTQASSLNEEVRDKLRKLTLRWRSESGRSRRQPNENSGSKAVPGDAQNYLNDRPLRHQENPGQTRENAKSTHLLEDIKIRAFADPVLNTSLTAYSPPDTPNLNLPIKVVCSIHSHIALQPLINELNQSNYPSLPDLTEGSADV